MLKPGTRIRLLAIHDPYTRLAAGALGTVKFIDDIGTIHIAWDTGEGLGLVPGEDSFEILTETEPTPSDIDH